MMTKIARFSLAVLLFLGLMGSAQLLAPPKALAQGASVQMGVDGMI